MQKFKDDLQKDDLAETAKIYSSIFLGNNRKRRRGDLEIDEMDETDRKKAERFEKRLNESDESEGFLKKR